MEQLSEKILQCRKKAGLSQEALAEILGVSRQAISKWEIGDAVPDLPKLVALAKAFDVSTDWLLTSQAPPQEQAPPPESSQTPSPQPPAWMDALPGTLGRLIRRYGWLYGVYTALSGLGLIAVGSLFRLMIKRMFTNPFSDVEQELFQGSFSIMGMNGPFTSPVFLVANCVIGLGILLVIAGTVLAIYLKKKSNDG